MMRPVAIAFVMLGTAACAPAVSPARDASTAEIAPQRGPVSFVVDGDPNGLWWDEREATLYFADDQNNRIVSWRDPGTFRVVAELPAGPPEGPGLGQLVRLEDGSWVVTRFGYGTSGDVVRVSPQGVAAVVPNLDRLRRRIGLTVAADGAIYDGWFVQQMSGRVGSVSRLSLEGTETEWVTGLTKPVGILAVGAQMFVSDQGRNEILVAEIANPAGLRSFAQVEGPDLLCRGPNNSLFAGSRSGVVFRIGADGTVSTFDTGYRATRGVAYDPTHGRLFVVDHDPDPSDGIQNLIRIVPVDS